MPDHLRLGLGQPVPTDLEVLFGGLAGLEGHALEPTGREGLAFQNPATTQLWHPDAPGTLPTDVAAAYQGYQACDPTRSYEDAYRDLVALCPTARAIYNTYYAGLFPPLPASVCP